MLASVVAAPRHLQVLATFRRCHFRAHLLTIIAPHRLLANMELKECAVCSAKALHRCSKCKLAAYCSPAHQALVRSFFADFSLPRQQLMSLTLQVWPKHKLICGVDQGLFVQLPLTKPESDLFAKHSPGTSFASELPFFSSNPSILFQCTSNSPESLAWSSGIWREHSKMPCVSPHRTRTRWT